MIEISTTYLLTHSTYNCVGCRACAEICPLKCISMNTDEFGFVYPTIDRINCIQCHACERVCPVDNSSFASKDNELAYYGNHCDKGVIYESSSGGAFTSIYRYALKNDYKVYGVKWDDNLKAVYDSAETESECEKFRKSKYLLADTNECFADVCNNLLAKKKVLFSGSPCVCSALKNYIKNKHVSDDDLLLVDIVCHGAGSQRIFDSYIEEEGDVVGYQFRFKNKNELQDRINSRSSFIQFADGHSDIRTVENDPYLKGYYGRLFYRDSCYKCKFAKPERVSDITLGDAWGIDDIDSSLNALSGVSILLANTNKGKVVVAAISEIMRLKPIDLDWVIAANAQLHKPTAIHEKRDKFFAVWSRKGFKKAIYESTKPRIRDRISRIIPKQLKRSIKKIIR